MEIAITANAAGASAPANLIFERCPVYTFVDTETMQEETVDNPALSATNGAGIRAAMFVIEHGAQALLTKNIGRNAFDVFQIAGVPVFFLKGDTVREAAETYAAGQLQELPRTDVQD
jgi:predicted Fe-Mo cluster-binding NifX family protein